MNAEWKEKKIAGGRLIDHAGGRLALRHELAEVAIPDATTTYKPVPYTSFLERLERQLAVDGFTVSEEQYMLSKDGMQMGALWGIQHAELKCDGFKPVLTALSSYNKTTPRKVMCGFNVTACLNQAMWSDLAISRRNTLNADRDTMYFMAELSARLLPAFVRQNGVIERFKNAPLTVRDSDHLMIESWRCGAINSSDIARVAKEYAKPHHEEFAGRTVWSLFNATTEVLKGSNFWQLPQSTRLLTDLFATEVGAGPTATPATDGVIPLEFPTAN